MTKRRLHHTLVQLRKVRPWYFVIAIAISGGISIAALRHNNVVALQLRDKVLAVDEKNGDVESALKELREHVYSHMNSQLAVPGGAYPPVQLKYRYDRLVAAEKDRVTQVNAQLYTEAQAHCESLIPTGRSLNRIQCIQDYITAKGAAAQQAIPDSLYKFDFIPPAWSPDLAGWALVVTAVLVIAFAFRTAFEWWLKSRVR